ncbi:MAG: hypothetical protein ACI97A_004073 [Planctomycetota bacterium]|jgi:hypothetical protein
MKHRYIILAIAAPLLLGACGIFKFGVGKVQNESEYKSVAVLEDGRTLLFTYNDRRVKREPIGLGWEKRTIYLRDTKYLCALDLKTGKQRILKELQNNRHGAPYSDLIIGAPFGNKVMVSHTTRDNKKSSTWKRSYFVFDGDVFANNPKTALRELNDLRSNPNREVNLVGADGTLLIRNKSILQGSLAQDLTIRRPNGDSFDVGRTRRRLSYASRDFVCFRDTKDLAWHSASIFTGEVRRLQGTPGTAGHHRAPYKVRAVRRPEHDSDQLLVWTAQDDGGDTEAFLQPHLALNR